MAVHLKLRKQPLHPSLLARSFSSSSPFSPPPPPSNSDEPNTSSDSAQNNKPNPSSPSFSSYFSDIREGLKSSPTPPRRIPTSPPPPSFSFPPPPSISFDEVRRSLASVRNAKPSSSPSAISFQDLLKNNVTSNPNADVNKNSNPLKSGTGGGENFSFASIRESLQQYRTRAQLPRRSDDQFSLKSLISDHQKPQSVPFSPSLPDTIFGKEVRERAEGEKKALKTEFVKMYSPEELGEKLRKLRPEGAGKDGKEWFSLEELNERLAKLRAMEEKELGGVNFRDLRESLVKLKIDDESRKTNSMQKMSILMNIGGQPTPTFMLKPPQEELLERYFHPDHMSSAEKMKLELQRVRDEFKMSENDCGSARVQVAQLTTKIKHLSAALHKKDKHSRKGLLETVQRRKKYLKYLRRTDWDSYCLVLSKLGLRDVPEYKAPDYKKNKSNITTKTKSKSKRKSKKKMKA